MNARYDSTDQVVPLATILVTEELTRRRSRLPDLATENQAITALAGELASHPDNLLEKLAELVLRCSRAESAGVSILEASAAGAKRAEGVEEFSSQDSAVFRWHAVTGALAPHVGGIMPRDASPCGTVIDHNATLLLDRPGRHYRALAEVDPPVTEALLVPFHAEGEPVGTVWAVMHSRGRQFDAEDARLIESLARFASAGYQLKRRTSELHEANLQLQREIEDRQRTQEALRHAKQLAEDIIDTVREPMLVLDFNLRVQSANASFYEMFQVAAEQTIGCSVFDLGNGQWNIPPLRELLEDVLPANNSFNDFHIEHDFETIGRRVMLLNARRIDQVQLILLAIEDITERTQALEALRHNEQRLVKMTSVEGVGVLTFDYEGRILDANDTFLKLFGYSREAFEAEVLTWRDFTPPEHVQASLEVMEQLGKTGRIGPYEKEYFAKDGSRKWMMFVGADLGDGTIVEYAVDISDRKQMEEVLHERMREAEEAQAMLDSLLEHVPEGITIVGGPPDFPVLANSRMAVKLIGREDDQLEGVRSGWHARAFGIYLADGVTEPTPEQMPLYRASRHGEHVIGEEWVIERPDQSKITVLVNVAPIRDSQGRIIGAINCWQDITERKKADNALLQAHEALQQQAGRLQRLASELSRAEHRERKRLAALLHDHLQQLLVAIRMSLCSVRSKSDDAAVVESAGQAIELTDEAVKASRDLTHQLRPPVLYEAGLIPALQWLGTRMQRQQGLRVTIEAETDSSPAQIGLEPDVYMLLFESVRELLFNTAKHAGVDEACVTVTKDERVLRIIVSDRGRGFDPAILRDERSDGSFGLFSVRERLTALGGSVSIDSAEDRGTSVMLEVPIRETAALEPEPDQAPQMPARGGQANPASDQRPISVLVVDDHAIVRQGIANILREHPLVTVVDEASDGAEAIEKVRLHRPDVVLMDVNMPEMNGIEATRAVHRQWPEVVVVGLSVQEDEPTASAMHEAGAAAFVSKSGDFARVIETITRLVRRGDE